MSSVTSPPAAPEAHATVQNAGLGILLRVCAVACMAAMFAGVKWTTGRGIPVMEVMFFRNAFAFLPLIVHIAATTGFSVLQTQRPGGHLARSAVGLTGMFCGFMAAAHLPLTEATALGFSAPLFMTALSALILREHVGRHRWAAVAVGFVGVMIMARPDPAQMASIGVVFALTGAMAAAGAMIAVRQIGRTEPGATIVFYFTLSGMLVGAASLPFAWTTPDLPTFAALAGLGLIGGCGQLFLTYSLKVAPISTVAPFDYTQLIWAGLFGFLIWGETPRAATVGGALVVAGSGAYILFRETRHLRRQR